MASPELHQLDTFYNSLNSNDQDALDSAAGGNFLDKMPQEGLAIIESKSKVRYSRSRASDSRVSTDAPLSNSSPSNNSFDMQQIAASLEDKMTIKMKQMMNEMKALVVTTPAPVKAVEELRQSKRCDIEECAKSKSRNTGTLEQLDWSLVGKIQVVAVDRLWEHIPITDMVKREVEIETVGECVDEIDKLAELIGEMQLEQEDRGCVHASNELHLHVVHVVAGEHEADQHWFTWVFFLATKDETSGILKSFITGIENLVDHKVKVIRCDNGTEFKNKEMNQFCEMKGILRQFSVARTPQQNGVEKDGIGH
ncbi:reverse transcriptase domain-containing protein [Tanacetum coccineum]|uniref:Reverse transcriptase domain-containing protein n=1 Tax=Tanacetum coccineum TaxID=301880 RepID=A0ABQ4YNW7_9ASTR